MRFFLFLSTFVAALLFGAEAFSAAGEVQIHLITMGPGDDLYTRGGHASLMVAHIEGGAPSEALVYNYGDTDWDDPLLVPNFLRGELTFFLTDSGSLFKTVQEYGSRQGRDVYRQRLALTPAQAEDVAKGLAEGSVVGKREYRFHHIHALCSTKIMDLLDGVTGGALRQQLAGIPGPMTPRQYQEWGFSGYLLAPIAADLFLGRPHDRVLDKYESAAHPDNMRAYLQTVMVPSPSGSGELVPVAEAPVVLAERAEPAVKSQSYFTTYLWSACILLLVGYGVSAGRRAHKKPEDAAEVILVATALSGLVGLLLLAFITLSHVPEFRENELILLFWPTDLAVALAMLRFRKRKVWAPWLMGYAHVRLSLAALVALGHLTGLLYQKPLIVTLLGVTTAATLWGLVRAIEKARAPRPQPDEAALSAS